MSIKMEAQTDTNKGLETAVKIVESIKKILNAFKKVSQMRDKLLWFQLLYHVKIELIKLNYA